MAQDPLELAKVFVKTVVRMFYETEHIVVVDALVVHGALTSSDLVLVLDMGKNSKGALKLVGKLREGGLVSVHVRSEVRDGAMKAVNREYFYIDYRRAIDAAKFKLHILDEKIKADAKPTQEKKEYRCPQCKAEWTTMEVLDKVDFEGRASGFLCRTCDHPLDSLYTGDTLEPENDDTPAKFNRVFAPLLKLMQRIDEVTIPHIEGEDAVKGAVPLPRDNVLNPAARHEVVDNYTVRPQTVKGIATAAEKIEVQIATNQEYTEAARAAEQQRQAKIAQQNLLPEWHTKSTVIEDKSANGAQGATGGLNGAATPSIKAETAEEKAAKDPELDAVFAALEEQRRQEDAAAAAEEEEEDDDDDDEDEFEDVDVGGTTPNPNGVPDAKRVRLESSAAPSPANGTPASVVMAFADGGDESEEDEFEDV
ncbi:hypothetical protein BDV96DRAFT_154842 [Lophiotrema nucula]|uniref:HTH TFE/IIEalpha-type domain-containing protein n=1 Tax=Lophiotrema nucula TaxID=690887 RepID=A0A6A5Z1B7_9PLEO|nr:hypothetical protein BDV96DRAFT_154842 [Lophiotrema nucula]